MGIDGVKEIAVRGVPIPLVRTFMRWWGYVRAIRRCRPDIVHVHYAQSVGGWAAAFADHHPLVVSVMGGDILFEEQGNPTPRTRWLTMHLLQCADLITVKSDYLMSVLDDLTGLGTKAIKVVWGIDLEHFRRVDASGICRELGIPANAPVILSPRLLQPLYNVHLIVAAMPEILALYPETRLLITKYLADKNYEASLAVQVDELGIRDRVIFCRDVPHVDMPHYYSLASVVVAVPPSDGLPQTLFEAMACETPNVLSRLPHYEEIVSHGESAYFVDVSPESIAAGVVHLLGNPELRQHIAKNGLRIVRAEANFKREVIRVENRYYDLQSAPPIHPRRAKRVKIMWMFILYLLLDVGLGSVAGWLRREAFSAKVQQGSRIVSDKDSAQSQRATR